MARYRITTESLVDAMQSRATRKALAVRAEKIRARASGLAAAEREATAEPRVEHGTRPKGRPYSRVLIDDGAPQEWGTSRTERRRILGRAGGAR